MSVHAALGAQEVLKLHEGVPSRFSVGHPSLLATPLAPQGIVSAAEVLMARWEGVGGDHAGRAFGSWPPLASSLTHTFLPA